jgi:hypothetical protein
MVGRVVTVNSLIDGTLIFPGWGTGAEDGEIHPAAISM